MTKRPHKKNRSEFIRDLVLASLADDYENLPLIIQDVTNWAKSRNIFPARDDI